MPFVLALQLRLVKSKRLHEALSILEAKRGALVTDHLHRTASVVVLGGINAAKALDDVAEVTLVGPTEAFVNNVAAWRAPVEPDSLRNRSTRQPRSLRT
jgi:hypothetical protein